jgi:hypothetical protein
MPHTSIDTQQIDGLKQQLIRLEKEIAKLEQTATAEAPMVELTESGAAGPSLAYWPVLPDNAEINRRLKIRFAELVQQQMAPFVARNELAGGIPLILAENKGGLLPPIVGEVKGADNVNININLPPAGGASTVPVPKEGLQCNSSATRVLSLSQEASESFAFDQEQAVIPGLKDRVKQKAEEKVKTALKEAADKASSNYVCLGRCSTGTCPTKPSAIVKEPVIVSSEATYDDSGWGSEITATATANIEFVLTCGCT